MVDRDAPTPGWAADGSRPPGGASRPGGGPAPRDGDDPAGVLLPDVCVQIQDPRTGRPPCLAGDARVQVETAIRRAVEADFPGAHVESGCVGEGQPAGEAAAFGIWVRPPDPLTDAGREAMRAGLARPIDRAPGQTIAFFLNGRFYRRLAERAWNGQSRRLDGNGRPQADGPVHLTALRVGLEPPATLVTTVEGFDGRPPAEAGFSVTIDETFQVETGSLVLARRQELDVDTAVGDVLTVALAELMFVTPWLAPLHGLAVYQTVQLPSTQAPRTGGVGGAMVSRFMPPAIAVKGGRKRPVSYTGRFVVKPQGVFAGGFVGEEVPRTPSMRLVGPSALVAAKGQGTVTGRWRAEVDDLRAPLSYLWTSDGEVEVHGSGAEVTVRFAAPPPGGVRLGQVGVTVTDDDALVVAGTRKVQLSVVGTPRGPRREEELTGWPANP